MNFFGVTVRLSRQRTPDLGVDPECTTRALEKTEVSTQETAVEKRKPAPANPFEGITVKREGV